MYKSQNCATELCGITFAELITARHMESSHTKMCATRDVLPHIVILHNAFKLSHAKVNNELSGAAAKRTALRPKAILLNGTRVKQTRVHTRDTIEK